MKVIPVIDLKNGLVVHAKHGHRDAYQPVQSTLGCSADIFSVLDAFLALADFDTFYIADLNAISKQSNHDALIAQVLAALPTKQFWVDKGYQKTDALTCPANYWPVLGSESYDDESVKTLANFKRRFVLSLDYADAKPLGAQSLFADDTYWPEQVIIMSLAQVGSSLGPDFSRLIDYRRRFPNRCFIAAGGVRNAEDLVKLTTLGIPAALVASALHSSDLPRESLLGLINASR